MAPRRAAAKPKAAKQAKEPAAGRKRAVEPSKEHDEAREVRRRVAPAEREAVPLVEHPSHQTTPGTIFMFGDGDCGQLGMGEDVTERLRPFPLALPGGAQAVQLALGGMHSAALAADGSVFTWGVNDEGALGRETAGELWEKSGRGSGRPGDAYTPGRVALPPEAGRLVQLSAGDSHTAALTERGAVWAWGTFRDASGVMGFGPHSRIQLTPALVYAPRRAEDQVLRIASGADHVAAVTRGGGLLTWGNGQQGQLGRVGERLSDRARLATLLAPAPAPLRRLRGVAHRVTDVACGTYSTFALLSDGHVLACGLNNYGQLALPGDAPVFAPTLVKALAGRGVAGVRGGQHHTLALTREGGLLSFGRPTYGRLGQRGADVASDAACPEPQPVDGLAGVRVAGGCAGLAVSAALSDDGRAWLWGFGTSNQLAKGEDDEDEVVPRALAGTKRFSGQRILQLEFGGQHAGLLCVPRQGGGGGGGAAAPTAEAADGSGGSGSDGSAAEEAAE